MNSAADTPSAATGLRCYHCGQAIAERDAGRWLVRIDGEQRPMCCTGCQTVAQTIVAAGFERYYRQRSGASSTVDIDPAELGPALRDTTGGAAAPSAPAPLRLYDEPEVQQRFVRRDGEHCEATLLVDGMHCGACVWLLEQRLLAQPGVEAAQVNLSTGRATVRWNTSKVALSALLAALLRIGYRARPFDVRQREDQIRRTSRQLLQRLFVAGLGMMQVMMYAAPAWFSTPGDLEPEWASLMRWASLLLTLPVMLYSATPFFAGAWRDLRARTVGMDVPVVIGLVAAFTASLWATLSGHGEVYFDSVTMFVFLLLGARYLEWTMRSRASRAVDAMAAALPDAVTLVAADGVSTERVPATRLAAGDLFRAAVGERIAVDARIVAGATAIDQSLLTGESAPVPRRTGDEVLGGAINAGNPVLLRALRPAQDSAISTIERLAGRAAADRPRLAGLADHVARVFVAALLVLAAGVWLTWLAIDAQRALPVAIAVLVVSCPCALSMATPAALAAASGAALRRGALIVRGDALEALATCTDVVFDKTGTLTRGQPRVVAVHALAAQPAAAHVAGGSAPPAKLSAQQVLQLAARLEQGQAHPLAEAIRQASAEHDEARGSAPADSAQTDSQADASHRDGNADAGPTDIASTPGLGLEATLDGRRYRLGAASFISDWSPAHRAAGQGVAIDKAADSEAGADSHVWLADEIGPLAVIHLRDVLRDEARQVVAELATQGLRVHLVSGDRVATVGRMAAELGLADWQGGAEPARKLAYIESLQRAGRRVMMVGDGINDAPVLAAADVSVAVGHATALARTSASVVLLGDSLTELLRLRRLAGQTRRIVRQNLGWAMLYNTIAIPAAAVGWVPPWLAALGMSASSLFVVANALRLIPRRGKA
ncbi:MAG: heavy metal translocating P-type ATPase [Burkholderiales bacterium]|nr:heavy metal translocating P-type ATPase [Burkholderiales bacterium]